MPGDKTDLVPVCTDCTILTLVGFHGFVGWLWLSWTYVHQKKARYVGLIAWNRPAVTGGGVLSHASAARPTLPVLILTGVPRLVDAHAAATLGAEKILKKPLNLAEWEQLAASMRNAGISS